MMQHPPADTAAVCHRSGMRFSWWIKLITSKLTARCTRTEPLRHLSILPPPARPWSQKTFIGGRRYSSEPKKLFSLFCNVFLLLDWYSHPTSFPDSVLIFLLGVRLVLPSHGLLIHKVYSSYIQYIEVLLTTKNDLNCGKQIHHEANILSPSMVSQCRQQSRCQALFN